MTSSSLSDRTRKSQSAPRSLQPSCLYSLGAIIIHHSEKLAFFATPKAWFAVEKIPSNDGNYMGGILDSVYGWSKLDIHLFISAHIQLSMSIGCRGNCRLKNFEDTERGKQGDEKFKFDNNIEMLKKTGFTWWHHRIRK